jgi:hypothetical protein
MNETGSGRRNRGRIERTGYNQSFRMILFYLCGEPVLPADRARLHGEPGEIEFIADPMDGSDNWHLEQYEGVYPRPLYDHYDDLEFVERNSF